MKRARRARLTGAFDTTDLVVGLIVAVAIPLVAKILIGMAGPPTHSTMGAFQEKVEIPPPPPDAEEVAERLAYARRICTENALTFLSRARQATGWEQKELLDWSRRSLDAVKREVTNLEFLISSTGVKQRFSRELAEMKEMEQTVDRGLMEVKELDLLGVLK
ncbi:MAG: hypothetical protein JXA90_10085 [Planctomycetes bacterium]|nr:hypothetical protein [Planctomycetota bacterium]